MKEKEYPVPSEVLLSLQTDRADFITHLIGKMEGGHQLPHEEQIGVLKALGSLVHARSEAILKDAKMRDVVRYTREAAENAVKQADKMEQLILYGKIDPEE